MLNSVRKILSGFNSVTTTTLIDITLPEQEGPVTQQVFFSVVNDLRPYNCIVGKAWLHTMKVFPSTYHQMVRYLISAGQVDLLSSQLVTRQCYQLSMREQRGKRFRHSSPRGSHSRTTTTAYRPGKGGRKRID